MIPASFRLLLLCLAASVPLRCLPAAPPDRPNILIVIGDDLTYHDVGCYGSPNARTPNIDRLAQQGMRLTHCFTATAMCAPTRQQLYTGLFPVRNGAYPNHSRVYDGTRSIVHHLQDLGYRVGLVGKKHFGPPDSFPFEQIPRGRLDEFVGRSGDKPFCLIYASNSPHLPWTAGDASQYNAEDLQLPPYLADTPEMRRRLTKYFAEVTDLDREVGACLLAVDEAGLRENTIFVFTSEQGAHMPHCKWTCYDTGLRTATIVRLPGRIEPGSVSHAMVQYVDILPTLIDAAGGDPQAVDTGRPGGPGGGRGFDGRSFLPVLLGERDEHRDVVYGVQTTRGIINGSPNYPIRSVRTKTHKLIWNLNHEEPFRNIVTTSADRGGYWKSWVEAAEGGDERAAMLVAQYQQRSEFELYDLRDDPFELQNMAAADSAEPIEPMRAKLRKWMEWQGDEGITTELRAKERQGRGD